MSNISPVDVYRKLNNGDALTDAEVCYGYKFYHDLEQQLRYCDRSFTLRGAKLVALQNSFIISSKLANSVHRLY